MVIKLDKFDITISEDIQDILQNMIYSLFIKNFEYKQIDKRLLRSIAYYTIKTTKQDDELCDFYKTILFNNNINILDGLKLITKIKNIFEISETMVINYINFILKDIYNKKQALNIILINNFCKDLIQTVSHSDRLCQEAFSIRMKEKKEQDFEYHEF